MTEKWIRHTDGDEVFYTSPLLDSVGARHLFATRIGGVSDGCFGGWNFAAGVGKVTDSERNVLQNYAIAARKFALTEYDICRSYQTHTDHVMTVTEEHRGIGTVREKFPFGVDGLVSATKDLLLSVRSADCVPILLYDPVRKVCAAVHAGWRGTAFGIAPNAVREMAKHGCEAKQIRAAIGPCICGNCYEVGSDVYGAFPIHEPFVPKENGKFLLDLPLANRLLLESVGVLPEQIDISGLCTCTGEREFFSHRRMGAERGTMSAFITI